MLKYCITFLISCVSILNLYSQEIRKWEYWFDGDYKNRVENISSDTTVAIQVDIDNLKPGVHFFNFRAIGTNKEVGNLYRTMFYLSNGTNGNSEIQRNEYWFDYDYENRVETISSDTTVTIQADIDNLEPGVHFFNFRAIGTNKEVGNLYRTMFYLSNETNGNSEIQRNEYWFDYDYENRVETISSDTTVAIQADIDNLKPRVHFFNFRAIGTNKEVGNLYRTMFYLPQKRTADISGYEYWFDNDTINKISISSSSPLCELQIDISSLSFGEHTFNFRAKNSLEEWGELYIETFDLSVLSNIDDIKTDDKPFDVYNLFGVKVLSNATVNEFNNLPSSIYIINGRKVLKK